MENVVYTHKNDCRDCYKCIRNCPVEAINMLDNRANIDSDRCIACGVCISVCPASAQRYRNDQTRVRQLLNSGKKVILSLAPSFPGEFDTPSALLIEQIKALGFYGVSETALGAQLVTYFQRKLLSDNECLVFSTACPTFVQLVMKYFGNLKKNLSPLFSPLLAHCTLLKKYYGEDIAIVFAGPCIAKKIESDLHPELLDVAITFDELKNLINKNHADAGRVKTNKNGKDNDFIPTKSNGGAIYPLDGGMIETIKNLKPASVADLEYFNCSGIEEILALLQHENFAPQQKLFCEFLACRGGCINGSALFEKKVVMTKKNKVSKYFKSLEHYSEQSFIEKYAPEMIITNYDFCKPVLVREYTTEEKKRIWDKLGKYKEEDFLDCGGCGYYTCDKFATACLNNRAEPQMCIISTKKQAIDKAKAFMQTTPLGICIIDKEQKIIECNVKFIELSVDVNIEIDHELLQRVEGKNIDKFFKISKLVKQVLDYKEKSTQIIHQNGRIFNALLFPFDNNSVVGCIIQDITEPSMKRDIVVAKAQDVIKQNLLTVQKIAFLLGETAAETEITLSEIVNAYKGKGER